MRKQTTSILPLPSPVRERWQPLRSGLVNLYKYDREEFHYQNGRLLLRGNNGTGKSRVLALQLPFLLDGEVNPERLEPDADPSRKIEWNLLMGRYADRTGYTWIEFGRKEEGANEYYLTIGCGLSAVEGRSGVRQWFFITNQRIGKDLELVSESNQVLAIDRLRGKIASAGRVFESAGPYRRAVNEALFQLDEDRYAGLVNLLIQLRRPQLTRRLEERELSRALSESLPPVSPVLVANIAEAFRELQSDRSQLDSSKAALAAVDQFLSGYRGYVEVAAKRLADRVLAAHDEYDASMKEILTAEAECDRSLAELARLKADLQRLSKEEYVLQAELAAFQGGTHTEDARAIQQLHREAAEKRKDSEEAGVELADASRFKKRCADEHARIRAVLEERRVRLTAATDDAARSSLSAGLERAHSEDFSMLDLHIADEKILKQLREKSSRAIHTQSERVEYLRGLNEEVALAKAELQRANAEMDQLSGLLDDAREHLKKARTEHQNSITCFLGDTSNWTADLSELPLPFDEAFLRTVSEWCDRPRGPNPFAAAIRKSVEDLNVSFSETRAFLKQIEKTQTAELNRFESERESIESAASTGAPIAELDAAIADALARLDSAIDSIQELNQREETLRREAQCAPADEAVREAYNYSVAVLRHMDSLRSRVSEAEEYVLQKQSHLDRISKKREDTMADLGIDGWGDDLEALKDGMVQYRLALSSLWPALVSFQEARTASEIASANMDHATAREARQKEIVSRLEQRALAAETARDAAARAADDSIDEILERVARTRGRLEALRIEERQTRSEYHDTEIAVTRLDERLRSRTAALNGETDRRDSAAFSLRNFASTGLLNLACAEIDGKDSLTWSTSRTVEVAFELASRLDRINAGEAVWENHQKTVPFQFTMLMQSLSAQDFESSAVYREDVFIASAVFAGQQRTMYELRRILSEEVAGRQMLLDVRVGEILENQLVGKVSSHLRELLHAAEEQVRQMNQELDSRPMSTGMKLRFVWQPSEVAPSGMAEARRRLMQLNDDWSAAERGMLGLFLQRQIEAVYSTIEGASWQESLAEALDYRRWHWFGVERYQDGVWKRLTHRTYGTGSGGEKAVALTLPHFAAAAAFYRTAAPRAPRLILLDEAFVGIDADMRAKCMGLIDIFDLDFMMTSEREWGCYQTLPGIAIYQLSTRPGIDAIGLTRWVWNGHRRNLLPHGNSSEAPTAEANSNEVSQESGESSGLVTVESPKT